MKKFLTSPKMKVFTYTVWVLLFAVPAVLLVIAAVSLGQALG